MLLKNISSVIAVAIFTYNCMFHFIRFSVSWFSDMWFGVMYFETWHSTQPYIAFSTHVFCSCVFVFRGTHMAPNSLTLPETVSCLQSSRFSWVVDGA